MCLRLCCPSTAYMFALMRSLEARFWEKVNVRGPDECWLWLGAVTTSGYGVLQRGGRGEGLIRAHRLSFEIENGPIPDGSLVLHFCNIKTCINPAHLFDGDYSQNLQQAWDDGLRQHPGRALAESAAKLSPEDVILIRQRRASGEALAPIAKDFMVTISCISSAARGVTWGHVD